MAVGQGSNVGHGSYLMFGRESTYGTYSTGTAGLAVLSASMKTLKEVKILEEMQKSRTNSNHIQLGRTIEGEAEFYFAPRSTACNWILQNAFGGGPVTSATATGETIGGLGFQHTVNISDFKSTYSSLSLNHRKGETGTGKIFEYTGLRVNEFSLVAELDEAVKAVVSFIGKDSSVSSNDVSANYDISGQIPLSFVSGRFSIENSNSFTTTSYWHVQNINFKLSNDLKGGSEARRIGSDTIDTLPAGMATFELSCEMRFDTTTAYDAMMNGTRLYGQFEFLGPTMTGSAVREGLKMTFPNLIVTDAGDPEVGSSGDVLKSTVSFAVLRDPTTSGYAVQAQVTNLTSSYA